MSYYTLTDFQNAQEERYVNRPDEHDAEEDDRPIPLSQWHLDFEKDNGRPPTWGEYIWHLRGGK